MALDQIYLDSHKKSSSKSYQENGLTTVARNVATGLSATTLYYFTIDSTEYDITTESDTTYAAIIDLMNDKVVNDGYVFSIESGDLRCTSDATPIVLAAGSTGTDLFATLTGWSSFATAVADVLSYEFIISIRRGILKQIRINFPIIYTGTVEWKLSKIDDDYDQTFASSNITALDKFYQTDISLYMQKGDRIIISTSAACLGESSIEIAFIGNGY